MVTGGAGYIGAHVVRELLDRGERVVVLDDLSTGAAERAQGSELVIGDIGQTDLVADALRAHRVEGVVHFAAKKQVGESVVEPLLYYRENVAGTESLLRAMTTAGVDRLVFSSSAAVYGSPDRDIVSENDRTAPQNPYGHTKLICEEMIANVGRATGLRHVSLRYFNVAGAASDELGDVAVLNLIPMVFRALAAGEPPMIFGDDYPTPDGTCIRDFVHVSDVAASHVAAFALLDEEHAGHVFNVGRGTGYSVWEVIACIREVTDLDFDPVVEGRRAGDPAQLIAGVDRIRDALGWEARFDLRAMVESAWSAFPTRPSS